MPIETLLHSVFGSDSVKDAVQDSPKARVSGDDTAAARERRAASPYRWMRKVPGRSYNVYNLDAVDQRRYGSAVRKLKSSFGGASDTPLGL